MQSGSKYGSEFLLKSVTGKVILIVIFPHKVTGFRWRFSDET